jgi:hypothetical protein
MSFYLPHCHALSVNIHVLPLLTVQQGDFIPEKIQKKEVILPLRRLLATDYVGVQIPLKCCCTFAFNFFFEKDLCVHSKLNIPFELLFYVEGIVYYFRDVDSLLVTKRNGSDMRGS